MKLKSDAKFKEKLNFQRTTQKSENFTSMSYFCQKYMNFELKNIGELSFMTINSDAKFE